jgi:hypothetical protein
MNVCNKQKYDKKSALTILNLAKKHPKKYRKEKRYYWCEQCQAHHVTSWEDYEEREEIDLIYKEEWEKIKAV